MLHTLSFCKILEWICCIFSSIKIKIHTEDKFKIPIYIVHHIKWNLNLSFLLSWKYNILRSKNYTLVEYNIIYTMVIFSKIKKILKGLKCLLSSNKLVGPGLAFNFSVSANTYDVELPWQCARYNDKQVCSYFRVMPISSSFFSYSFILCLHSEFLVCSTWEWRNIGTPSVINYPAF
jgi:hypothetical protein